MILPILILFLAAGAAFISRRRPMGWDFPANPQTGMPGDCCFAALYNCLPWWRRGRALKKALAWHKQHAVPVSEDHRVAGQAGGVYANDARKIYRRAGLRQVWFNEDERPVSPAKITELCRAAGGSGIVIFEHHACAFRDGVWRAAGPPHGNNAFVKDWGAPAEVWAA